MKQIIAAMSERVDAMRRALNGPSTGVLRPPAPAPRPHDPNAPTVLIINDSSDQINYGAEALVHGLHHILDVALPNHTRRLIPSHWLDEAGIPSWFHSGNSLEYPGESTVWPAVADQFDYIADEWQAGRGGKDAPLYLEKLKGVDIVVLNGEGSIYRTNISAIRELFLAWFAKTRLGLPTVFINGTVQLTLIMPVLPAMVRKTFRALDAVAVRGPYSLRNVQEFVPDLDVRLFPDSALSLPVDIDTPSAGVKALFNQLGESDFFCFDPGPMTIDHDFGKRSSLFHMITRVKSLGLQAVMVVSGPPEAAMLKQLAAATGSIYLEQQPSYRDLMAVLARAKFQISGRNHNLLLGARVGCPAIALASISHKVHGVCEQLQFGAPYDGTDLFSHIERIAADAASMLARGASLRDEIRSHTARLSAESFEMGALVRDVLARYSTQAGPRLAARGAEITA
jgi:polysaccharide pyruvyl transferase WcaK-like protein